MSRPTSFAHCHDGASPPPASPGPPHEWGGDLMTASQHMVQANGLRFRAMVDGPAGSELVVLLHGFPEGAESWSKQVDVLARAGALAVEPDRRGYGLTDAPPHVEDYAIANLVQD